MFTRKTRDGWMAIDVRPACTRLAHVAAGHAKKPRLRLLQSVARTGSEDDDLAQLRRSLGLQRYRCTTAIDAGAYQIVQIKAPAVLPAEMNAALRWGVKDLLDFPADEAVIDSLDVPTDGAPAGRGAMVLAVAARRGPVAARVRSFQRSGVPLAVIDIAEAAQRNLAALFEQPDRVLAFLAFDASGGLLTFSRNGELYALRRVEASVASLADGAAEPARRQLFERIALELQRSLDNFDRLFSQLALQRVVVAPHDGCEALVAYLRENLAPPIEVADLAGSLDCDDGVELGSLQDQAEWLRPIGLALRDETQRRAAA